jgi:hypothetical protein
MADDLETAAARVLGEARGLQSATDEVRAQIAGARAALAEASRRLDGGWASLLAGAQALLDGAEAGERELSAALPALDAALEERAATVDGLVAGAREETGATRHELEDLAERAEALAPELVGALAAADEAEAALRERIALLRGDLEQAVADVERELQVELAAELKAFESEVERSAAQVQVTLDECLSAVDEAARELFERLVQAEDQLRQVLEAAAAGAETAAEAAQQACGEGYEGVLARLERDGGTLTDALAELRGFLEVGHQQLATAQERCQDGYRDTTQSAREARQALRDLEEALSRYGFVRL